MTLFDITKRDMPCCYFLSYDGGDTLVLFVHEGAVGELVSTFANLPRGIAEYGRELGIQEEFLGQLKTGRFGFGGRIGVEEDHPFFRFLIPLPCIKSVAQGDNDWTGILAVNTSLSLLLGRLAYLSKETSADFPQVLTAETKVTERRIQGFSLSGYYSLTLVRWLNGFESGSELPEVTNAVISAHVHIHGDRANFREEHFQALKMGGGYLVIRCPGNTCGISPEKDDRSGEEGLVYSSHNVDGPSQQLQLLVGLAALTRLCLQGLGFGDKMPK